MPKIMCVIDKITGKDHQSLVQFIKFGLVGASNSIIYYLVEMLSYYRIFINTDFSPIVVILLKIGISLSVDEIKVVVVTAIAFIISVINSYFWNSRYVFNKDGNMGVKQHVAAFLKTVLCYGVTGLIISPIIKITLKNIGIAYWITSLVTLMLMLPLNFILNKFWAFGSERNRGI
ncbi:MAG: GtrA family protein [Lachnospiraceae bacterium]|nr:GtrA family protein [Lachnospiraceae bacterium]